MEKAIELTAWYIKNIKCEGSEECINETIEKVKQNPKIIWAIFLEALSYVWHEYVKKKEEGGE